MDYIYEITDSTFGVLNEVEALSEDYGERCQQYANKCGVRLVVEKKRHAEIDWPELEYYAPARLRDEGFTAKAERHAQLIDTATRYFAQADRRLLPPCAGVTHELASTLTDKQMPRCKECRQGGTKFPPTLVARRIKNGSIQLRTQCLFNPTDIGRQSLSFDMNPHLTFTAIVLLLVEESPRKDPPPQTVGDEDIPF